MKYLKYYLIISTFVVEAALLSTVFEVLSYAPVWYWVLVGFAAFRAARTISYNAIGRPLRAPFTQEEPDGSGAGDTVNPKRNPLGETSVIGELLACPVCTGTHAAAWLLIAYGHYPPLGLALVAILGVAGVAEILNWAACAVEWQAHRQREETGKIIRQRPQHDPARWRTYNANLKREKTNGQKVEERE